ncbi:MAG TPA: GH1 family beta-glucosidase [Steroidobacteraceae bacterium]|nr:GH1 family beta-glucosidase [Steroidobacteraceae bacterium]
MPAMPFTRRQFAQRLMATAAVTAASLPRQGEAAEVPAAAGPPAPRALKFPAGFLWGCATSAYQIEGAVETDGRGRTIWDAFAHTPGKIHLDQTGDVADDSYHRFAQDVRLLRELGAKTYRFSIAWARIFPRGTGKPNDKGLAYYDRLVDELLKNDIAPYATLFHWDLPEALPGGWQSRDTAKAFGDYAGFVAKRLSDRVRHFMTTNEMVCFTDLSYKIGQFAPGLKLGDAAVNQIRHHAVLAHGFGVQAIRAAATAGTQVGFAENPKVYVPVIETTEHIEAAKRAFRQENAPFITTVLEGRYPDEYLEREGANAPKIESGDMDIIGSPLDFVGLNVYQPEYARADASKAGYAVDRRPTSYPRMASPWLFIGPEAMYWAVRLVTELWNPKTIYITENGCSGEDYQDDAGLIEDTDRVMFLRNYLTHLHRAVSENFPVKGYFLWSLMDNFEWADGYGKRFGIYHVDFKTQERTPKRSALWYREVATRNAVG